MNNATHSEYVLTLQGRNPKFRFGSDRTYNARMFLVKNADALLDFATEELHPDVVEQVRKDAADTIEQYARLGFAR